MAKAKGQLSRSRLNAEYPHQVILPCSKTTGADNYNRHLAFITQVGGSRQGHSIYQGNEWHRVFCFREAEHSEEFRRRFGGAPFDPRLLGGANWATLRDKPPAESKLERWRRISARTKRL